MRTMTFSVLGAAGGSAAVQGTVLDLLVAIPYLFAAQLIPPGHVLNDLFSKGVLDAGMSGGCSWEPFEISQRRVEADSELASLVMAHRGKGIPS